MINCIIVDDDAVSVNLLQHFVTSTEGLGLLQVFNNAIEAGNYIRKNESNIDLIFLDIEMPGMSGIELMESFKNLPPTILISSKDKYAVKAFEHRAVNYLLKPLEYGKFLKALEPIFELYQSQKGNQLDYLFLKDGGILSKVNHREILFFESLGDYVKVHVKDKAYTVNTTMKNVEDKLKNNSQFMRVHRSYTINLNYLENFDSESAIVSNKPIPIGNKYRSSLQTRLNIL
jgi:two-component system response regulator LytT